MNLGLEDAQSPPHTATSAPLATARVEASSAMGLPTGSTVPPADSTDLPELAGAVELAGTLRPYLRKI